MSKVRVNLANPQELLELPGIDRAQADAIVRFRAEHGPITNARGLSEVLRRPVNPTMLERVDFDPAEATAPEAPGS